MSNTIIGKLFSLHNVNAVMSITFKPLSNTSWNDNSSNFVAVGSFSGSAV